MYAAHFGFTDLPFRFSPDPRFHVETEPLRAAHGLLRVALDAGDPFLALLGEPGVGKSTLVTELAASLPAPPWRVVVVRAGVWEGEAVLHAVAEALDVELNAVHDPLARLTQALHPQTGPRGRLLLVMEDAEDLSLDSLQWLQRLVRLHGASPPVLQVLLVAATVPPALQGPLASGALLLESVVTLQALDTHGTLHYLHHRLQQAGWRGTPAFDEPTVQAIHRTTGGVPGRLNRLCDRLLLHLYMAGRREFQPGDVEAVEALQQAEWEGREVVLPLSTAVHPLSADASSGGATPSVASFASVESVESGVPGVSGPMSSPRGGAIGSDGPPLLQRALVKSMGARGDEEARVPTGEPLLPVAWPTGRRWKVPTLLAATVLLLGVGVALWRFGFLTEPPPTSLATKPPVDAGAPARVHGAGTEAARVANPNPSPTATATPSSPPTSTQVTDSACSPAQDAMGLCTAVAPVAAGSAGSRPPAESPAAPTPCDAARRALGLCSP